MKHNTWMMLLIGTLLLAACAAPRVETQLPDPVISLPTATLPAAALPTAALPLAAPASAPAITAAATSPAISDPIPDPLPPMTVVAADGLNLRVGPGLNYRIREVLMQGEQVRLMGRSQDGEWINVRTEAGADGWVFGAYLESQAAFSALPVVEAYGGPVTDTPAEPKPIPARYRMDMTISGNAATVVLAGFPADTGLLLRLAVKGGGPSMSVASGKTGADGSVVFTFDMPLTWPDGSAVTQDELTLTATDDAGRIERSITVIYDSGR